MGIELKSRKAFNFLITISIFCFILFIVFIFIGFDKITNYSNNNFESVNAYVGGDAYNYIINGTYFTGYLVLASAFFIGSILLAIAAVRLYFSN